MKRPLTPAEERAYAELAAVARKLKRLQAEADRRHAQKKRAELVTSQGEAAK